MIIRIIKFIPVLFVFCSCEPTEKKQATAYSHADSVILFDDGMDIIGKDRKTNPVFNPFNTEDKTYTTPCLSGTTKEVFDSTIRQFKVATTPIEIGPLDQAKNIAYFYDSLFLVRCLKDEFYFNDEMNERTYSYEKGRVISRTDQYTICIFPMTFNVGLLYYMYSFNASGEMISKLEFAGQASDAYELYGYMKDEKNIEIYKNEFGFNKKLFIEKRIYEKYIINEKGFFVKQ